MSTIEEVNQELIRIWSNQSYSKIVPMLYPELQKNSFLWVGINPSYSPKRIKPVLRGTPYEYLTRSDCELEEFFMYKNDLSETDQEKHQDIQKLHHTYYPFFKSREKVYEAVKSKFPINIASIMPEIEHIDLFHVRVTDSLQLYKDLGQKEHYTFFQSQVNLFEKILTLVNPKAIIIANSKLSNYLLGKPSPIKFKGELIKFYDILKTCNNIIVGKTNINNNEIPVIFFKQLTGGGTTNIDRQDLIDQLFQVFANFNLAT